MYTDNSVCKQKDEIKRPKIIFVKVKRIQAQTSMQANAKTLAFVVILYQLKYGKHLYTLRERKNDNINFLC